MHLGYRSSAIIIFPRKHDRKLLKDQPFETSRKYLEGGFSPSELDHEPGSSHLHEVLLGCAERDTVKAALAVLSRHALAANDPMLWLRGMMNSGAPSHMDSVAISELVKGVELFGAERLQHL